MSMIGRELLLKMLRRVLHQPMNLLISQLRMGLACKNVMTSKEQHGRRNNLKKNSQMMLDSNLNQEKTFLDSMLMSLLNKLLRHNHKISKTHREHIMARSIPTIWVFQSTKKLPKRISTQTAQKVPMSKCKDKAVQFPSESEIFKPTDTPYLRP